MYYYCIFRHVKSHCNLQKTIPVKQSIRIVNMEMIQNCKNGKLLHFDTTLKCLHGQLYSGLFTDNPNHHFHLLSLHVQNHDFHILPHCQPIHIIQCGADQTFSHCIDQWSMLIWHIGTLPSVSLLKVLAVGLW